MIDPTTGLPRLIFGDDQGIWSVLDNNGTFETQIGASDPRWPGINRNGNLQITQFYYGAAQPSNAAAQIAGALFYGSAQDNGGPVSDPGVINNGNIVVERARRRRHRRGHRPARQRHALPVLLALLRRRQLYRLLPGQRQSGRTFGLLQASGGLPDPRPAVAVHGRRQLRRQPGQRPGHRHQLERRPDLRHHQRGRDLVRHRRPGGLQQPRQLQRRLGLRCPRSRRPPRASATWAISSTSAPRTDRSTSPRTAAAAAPATTGSTSPLGLDGSAVESIITDPTRGSHDAYAVTTTGVFYIADSIPSANNPTTPTVGQHHRQYQDLAYSIFGQSYNPTTDPNATKLQPGGLPVLDRGRLALRHPQRCQRPRRSGLSPGARTSAANSGVYQSLDDGQTWTLFPDTTYGAVAEGGNLPHVSVTSLSLSLGNIDPNTGMPDLAGPYNPNRGGSDLGSAPTPTC